jgi:GT2 family glycosyltransferase
MTLQVGVVTVTYRGGDRPGAWAAALQCAADEAGAAVTLQAVAIDNASGDGTADRLRAAAPWVDVVELPENKGFAAGCNAGVQRLDDPDVVAFVNPDVRVGSRFLLTLAMLDWPPHVAARGPLVHGLEGTIEQSARGFPRATTALLGRTSLLSRLLPEGRMTRRELRADPAVGTTAVDWVSGACLITTPVALQRVGGLDEGYFMYWEDADWCRRAADLGLTVQYEPSLEVRHDQGSSSSYQRTATVISFHSSALRYWRLHVARSPLSTALAACVLTARCTLKLLVLALRSRRRSAACKPAES